MIINKENLKRLDQFKTLEKGWMGYNENPISIKVIENAKVILKNIIITDDNPDIFPCPDNSVQMQWRTVRKKYIEIQVFDDKIVLYKVPEDKEYTYNEIEALSIEKAIPLIDYKSLNEFLEDIEKDKEINKKINVASNYFIKKNNEAYTKLADK